MFPSYLSLMQDSSELPLGQFVISGAHVPFYKNPGPAANLTTSLLAGADVPEDEIDPLSKAARFLCFYLTGIPVVKSLDMDEGPAFGCQVRTVMQQQEHLDRTTENLCDYHHAQREECCQLQEAVSSDYTRVLKMMKYFHQAVARHVTERSDKADLERLTKTLGNVKPRGVYNHDPTVVACKYGRTKLSTDCDFFSRWLTAGGMGYTFNHVPFWDMFTETEANRVFFHEMYAKENLTRQEEGIPRNIVSMGSAFSFELMAKFQDYRGARLMVHSPWELPEEGDSGLRLEAGRTYTIKLVPSAITTDGAAKALDPADRECLFGNEGGGLGSFSSYSQSSCLLECQLRRAAWDSPAAAREDGPPLPICHLVSAELCFRRAVAEAADPRSCRCPGDCASARYTQSVDVRETDVTV